MNYYQHHLGDYSKHTGHLSLVEHGAYRMLLDHYYATENPLPNDIEKLCRICRATSKKECAAVQSVVTEFFTSEGGVLRHGRVDEEICNYHAMSEKNRKNGMNGGRPKKTQWVSSGFDLGNPNETEASNHKPRTNNQEPEGGRAPAPATPPGIPKSPEECADKARTLGVLPEVAKAYWLERDSVGWMKRGANIHNWQSDLKAFAARWASNAAERRTVNGKPDRSHLKPSERY